VVKVQYPGVDKALESDIANAGVLVRGFSLAGDTLDGRPYYEEVRASLLRELDYVAEAAQLQTYARAASAYPELVVPEVIPERSAKRVLTLTRLDGPNVMEFIDSSPPDADRFRVARLLVFAIWGPFYRARLVHADPHPGNFLVLPDGRMGVLDFGATKLLSPKFANVYREFLDSIARGEKRRGVKDALEQAGFTFRGDDDDDQEALVEKIADIVEEPARSAEYDFAADSMVWRVKRVATASPGLMLTIRPPPEAVLFYRSAAGLAQDLRLLKAKGPFRSLIEDIRSRGREADA
jgi:predicted unusual protein kinase regulating ubiquinone biosynthesis (AarF/ABC1/UbiB family)